LNNNSNTIFMMYSSQYHSKDQVFCYNLINKAINKMDIKMLQSDCITSTLAYNDDVYFFSTNYTNNSIYAQPPHKDNVFAFFRYNFTSNICYRLQRMHTERNAFASIASQNQLFIFGGIGTNDDELLASCECY